MTITRNLKLYLNAGTASAPYINVNQYDEGEEWVFTLYNEDGSTYTPSSGAIIGIKSDGNAIMNAGSVVGGKVVITETEQMTAASGRAIFELLIDNATHGTANFIVNVERRPSDDAEFSDSDLSMLQEAIDAAEVINEILDEGGDPSEIIAENVDAWLDNHPEATTTVQDGAITAPKINNSLWDKLLVSEEASGNPASFDDGADDVPVNSLKVALEPIQIGSGDPSPSNVRPIYPANGKNLFDVENANILNGYINGSNVITSSAVDRMVYIPVLANQTFSVTFTQKALSTATQSDDTQIGLFDSTPVAALTGVRIYNATRTAPTDDMKVTYTGSSSSHTWLALKIGNTARTDITASMATLQIEYGAVTPYAPYQGIMVDVVGRNLFGGLITTTGTQYGVTYTANLDGTFTVNGTNNSSSVSDYRISGTGTYRLDLPVGNYVLNGGAYGTNGTGNTLYITIKDANNQIRYIGNNGTADSTFSIAEGEYIASSFIRFAANGTANNLVFKPMIRRADDTDRTFAPYVGNSYPYTLGQSVYGGTVDLATGVLTVTHGFADENSFTALATGTSAGGLHWAEYLTSDITTNGYALSNMGTRKDGGTGWASTIPCFAITDLSKLRVYCAEGTLADFKSAYSGLQIVYPLATPQTIQLTTQEVKTLLGYNNISSSGTVDVIYHADTKLYVDKMTAVDNAIIAPTEEGFTATRNYTVNDLVIVNDTLYKVTSNIATGSAITPNSNVQQTTLGALIKALS